MGKKINMKNVLVFSRDINWGGGVVNFIDLLRKNVHSNTKISIFLIGRRRGKLAILRRPFILFIDAVRLLNLLKNNRYDAFHLNPSLDLPSLIRDGLFLIILRLYKAKNVYVVFHGWIPSVERAILKNKLFIYLFLKIFGYARKTLVLTDPAKRALIGFGFNPDNIILFTTMFGNYSYNQCLNKIEKRYIQILFLSRLVKGKGALALLHAFSNICGDYGETKLIIAGNGPEENTLKRFVSEKNLSDRVTFVGYVKDKDKENILYESDIFVLPSETEGCPVSMLEAMATGSAIIATHVGGIPRIIKNGVNGILLEDTTTKHIEKALTQLLDKPGLIKKMSIINISEAWKKYNAKIVTEMFESLYAQTEN